MKGLRIERRMRGMFRESASAAAELRPVTEVGHPLSIVGFTSVSLVLVDNACQDLRVIKALLLANEKTLSLNPLSPHRLHLQRRLTLNRLRL